MSRAGTRTGVTCGAGAQATGLSACNNGPKRLDMGGRCLTLGGTGPDKYPEACGHLAADATAKSSFTSAHPERSNSLPRVRTRRDRRERHERIPGGI